VAYFIYFFPLAGAPVQTVGKIEDQTGNCTHVLLGMDYTGRNQHKFWIILADNHRIDVIKSFGTHALVPHAQLEI
jgi:hypothetical protein